MQLFLISIHAPRTGSDEIREIWLGGLVEFQSTLPARGATLMAFDIETTRLISIHAPRTGSDHGGGVLLVSLEIFQSTLPARGATCQRGIMRLVKQGNFNPRSPHGERPHGTVHYMGVAETISIHAPRTGSDTKTVRVDAWAVAISIHAPRTGSDKMIACGFCPSDISIHAPRTGSDTRREIL